MHGLTVVFRAVMRDDANDDSDGVPSDESDALDEVALASVNQALEAVENEEVVEEVHQEEETPQPPRNVIPELEDADDPEEMVQVLLTVGEERSRRGDVKGPSLRSTKPSPSILMRHGMVQQRRLARGPTGCSRGTPIVPNLPRPERPARSSDCEPLHLARVHR